MLEEEKNLFPGDFKEISNLCIYMYQRITSRFTQNDSSKKLTPSQQAKWLVAPIFCKMQLFCIDRWGWGDY